MRLVVIAAAASIWTQSKRTSSNRERGTTSKQQQLDGFCVPRPGVFRAGADAVLIANAAARYCG